MQDIDEVFSEHAGVTPLEQKDDFPSLARVILLNMIQQRRTKSADQLLKLFFQPAVAIVMVAENNANSDDLLRAADRLFEPGKGWSDLFNKKVALDANESTIGTKIIGACSDEKINDTELLGFLELQAKELAAIMRREITNTPS